MIKPIIIANWKANNQTYKISEKNILETYKGISKDKERINLLFAPSAVHISKLNTSVLKRYKVRYAAQDVSVFENGSHTGEITAASLKDVGVNLVIVGHSERREQGDDDSMIVKKVENALNNKMEVVLCIGEKNRDDNNEYLIHIEKQITNVFDKIDKSFHKNIIIAYEPIWAINNKNNEFLNSKSLLSMVIFIRKIIHDRYGQDNSKSIRVLYGGSVNEENVQDLFWNGEVHGFLVGRSSVESKTLVPMVKNILINPNKNILKNYAKKRPRS